MPPTGERASEPRSPFHPDTRVVWGLAVGGSVLLLLAILGGPLAFPSRQGSTPSSPDDLGSPSATPSAGDRFVGPGGDDDGPGTLQRPFETVAKGLETLRPGQTLWLRQGTYREDITSPQIRSGRSDARITVAAYPGEHPTIRGLLWLDGADYWTLDGLYVTWAAENGPGDHMVKMTNGVGWEILNGRMWGARSFSALLVAGTKQGEPSDWVVRGNCIYDVVTQPIHHVNGDHNLYVNTGTSAGPGVVERNILFHAPNGQNIKLGYGRSDPQPGDGTANVTIRFNTLYGALKNLSVADDSHDITIERNIIQGSDEGYAVRSYRLVGERNVVRDNLLVGMEGLQYADEGYGTVIDGGGNARVRDLDFDARDCDGFVPSDPTAERFGRYGR